MARELVRFKLPIALAIVALCWAPLSARSAETSRSNKKETPAPTAAHARPAVKTPAAPAAPTDTNLTDLVLQRYATEALEYNEATRGLGIQVNVDAGNATLSGSVESDSLKSLAEETVTGVRGVAKVVNNIQVVAPDALDLFGAGTHGMSESAEDVYGLGYYKKISPEAMTKAFEKSLKYNPRLSKAAIQFEARDGRINLTGVVDSEADRREAARVARQAPGVRYVQNQIQVAPRSLAQQQRARGLAPSAGTARQYTMAQDQQTANAVRSSLSRRASLRGAKIRVHARQNQITLSGTVGSYYEKNQAEKIASQSGAARVRNNIKVHNKQYPTLYSSYSFAR